MEPQVQTNSNAIVSLVLGILTFFIPFLGFIFGILGIILSIRASKQIKITNENGKGLATAGLVCSIIGFALQLFMIIGIIAFSYFIISDVSY